MSSVAAANLFERIGLAQIRRNGADLDPHRTDVVRYLCERPVFPGDYHDIEPLSSKLAGEGCAYAFRASDDERPRTVPIEFHLLSASTALNTDQVTVSWVRTPCGSR